MISGGLFGLVIHALQCGNFLWRLISWGLLFIICVLLLCVDLYPSPNIVQVIKSRRMRWVGHVASMGERTGLYGVLVGKPEGKSPLGRPRHSWEDDIRICLQEVGCGVVDWIMLAQDRDRWWALVTTVMNLQVPCNAGNFLIS